MKTLKWRKLGKIFDPATHGLPEGCVGFTQSPQALAFDGFVRVYFSSRERDPNGKYVSRPCYADFDPELRAPLRVGAAPVMSRGGLGCFDEHGIFPFSPLRHEGRLLAYTTGWTRRVSVSVDTGIGLAIGEPDGASFRRVGEGPVLAASLHEPFLVADAFVRPHGGRLHMWYIAGTGWRRASAEAPPDRTYKLRHAVSDDGVAWEPEGRAIVADALGPDESQALPTVVRIGALWHMFFCFRESFDFRQANGRGYRLGHAWSDDLVAWTRDDEAGGLARPADGWDSEMMCYPHAFEHAGRVWLLYNGNAFGRDGFGAAVLE